MNDIDKASFIEKHYSLTDLSKILCRHKATVKGLLEDFNINVLKFSIGYDREWANKEDIDRLIDVRSQFYTDYYTYDECRRVFDTNKNTLAIFFKREGIETLIDPFDKTQKVVSRKKIDNLKKEIDEFYRKNIALEDISKEIGVTRTWVDNFLKRNNIDKLKPIFNTTGRVWVSKEMFLKALKESGLFNHFEKANNEDNLLENIEKNNFLNTHYILADIGRKLHLSSSNIKRFLNRHRIPIVQNPYHKGQKGVPKNTIDSIIVKVEMMNVDLKENILMKIKDLNDLENRYYNFNEVVMLLHQQFNIGKRNPSAKQFLQQFNIKLYNPFSIKTQIGVLKEDLDNIVMYLKENYMTLDQINKIFNSDLKLTKVSLKNILFNLATNPSDYINILGTLYFKVELITKVFSIDRKYCTPFEVLRTISKETKKPPKSMEKFDKLISSGEMQKLFKDFINPGNTDTPWLFSRSELVTYIQMYKEIIRKNIVGRDALKKYLNVGTLSTYIPIENTMAPRFFTKLFFPTGRSVILYDKEDASRFISNPQFLTVLDGTQYPLYTDLIKDIIKSFKTNTELCTTLDIYNGYIEETFENAGTYEGQIQKIRDLSEAAKIMLENMAKEIIHIKTPELVLLLEFFPTKSLKYTFWSFARYVEKRHITKYTTKHIPIPVTESVQPKEKVVIELDELLKVYSYCKDIKLHIPYSINDKNHSHIWLTSIILLTNAWRMTDIYRIPIIDPKAFGVPNMEWLLVNQINIVTAQKVINIIRSYNLVVSKTGQPRDFTCNKELLIPLVTAIFISAFHSLATNDSSLIDFRTDNRKFNRAYSGDFFNFFSKSDELKTIKFSAQIANRSLLEHLYYAILERNKKSGSYSAFELMVKLRSHSSSDTTSIYIRERNQVLLGLFDRGEFGYIYDQILDFLTSNNEKTFRDRTDEIISLKEMYNPLQVEQLGSFFNEISLIEEEKRLISSLMNLKEEEFFEYNRKLFLGEMPSKEPNVQCMAYPNCYRISNKFSCNTCVFSVHTVYSLIYIFDELLKSIVLFENTALSGVKKREAIIINKLLELLKHAIQKHGEEYVFSFCENEEELMGRLLKQASVLDQILLDGELGNVK